MNAALLLQHYDQISDAADSVDRLRRFILDLAVRGRLTAQITADDEVDDLLNDIAKHKSVTERSRRRISANAPERLSQEDQPYPIPLTWAWVRFGDIVVSRDSERVPVSKADREKREKTYDYYGASGVIDRIDDYLFEKPLLLIGEDGANLVLRSKPIAFIARGKYWVNNHAHVLDGISEGFLRFLEISINATDLTPFVTGTAQPKMNQAKMNSIPVALPPLAEQHRIVAKVDELLALCDQLEEARNSREATRDKLTAASLTRLTDARSIVEEFRDSARFALGALPSITHRQDQIKGIRQAIFDLAVRGKLVEQYPNDEPASALLERVSEEVERLNSGGRKAKSKATNQNSEEFPFDLPRGWAWTTFPKVGKFGRGKSKHRPRNDPKLFSDGIYPMVQTGDVARSQGRVNTFSAKYNDCGLQQSMVWPSGTLCITIAANIADSGILQFDACFPDSVVGLVPASEFESAVYFEFFVRTAKSNLLEFAPATAQKNINLGILEAVKIPLPPLAEQKRIVAKVDELMGICDQLEASLSAAETKRARLLEATLREALEPAQGALKAAE
ncbi:restriction endonuclease subunit S [Ruegeria hyattellae]|uniref:restriction endonuclease subunit S n=1 Tax=Ruegeria hyattellae TaxID=3233337 RepID=UPI00355C8858